MIEERPSIGDLEIDTVIGANHKGALVTVVDRISLLFKKLSPNKLTRLHLH
ncbi:MAG: Unknown protein [uncultured Campylobacterales bacterium]|uniref:Uncharacterized protein n=1 Tax=uncultured Campylobacterales bacterium TaxID=352960 RepID=A0A6S6SDY9_9BACT|nr:MAG: Unknown protein [uncultured Campylobacterales bacterium]